MSIVIYTLFWIELTCSSIEGHIWFTWWSTYTHSQQITRNTFKNRHDIHIPSMVFAFSPQTRWARMCQMTWESIIVHPSLIVDKFAASKLDHYERCVRRTIWNEMGPYIYIYIYIVLHLYRQRKNSDGSLLSWQLGLWCKNLHDEPGSSLQILDTQRKAFLVFPLVVEPI